MKPVLEVRDATTDRPDNSLGALSPALPATAQSLDLTMGVDLTCGAPPSFGQLHVTNVTPVGWMCNFTVDAGGDASVYGINLTSPMQVTVAAVGNPIQIVMLQSPYTADDCVATAPLTNSPTLTVCLPAGYYAILLSTPVRALIDYQVSVTCAPCTPVAAEERAWGGLKSLFR